MDALKTRRVGDAMQVCDDVASDDSEGPCAMEPSANENPGPSGPRVVPCSDSYDETPKCLGGFLQSTVYSIQSHANPRALQTYNMHGTLDKYAPLCKSI